MNKFLLSLLLLPSLALTASVTGTVTLLDGTPLGGAVVKVGADSVVSLANGSFSVGRSTGIASKSGKTIPVTSHLSIVEGRPRLSFGGFDIAGRARPATVSANTETPRSQAFGARSVATRDTFKLTWNGKRLFALPVPSDTTVAFKIDTAWKDDAGIPWNPRVSYGSLFDARDGQTYRTVAIGTQTWMAENLNKFGYWGMGISGIESCYNDEPDSCAKYGRLYSWGHVMYRSYPSASYPSGVIGICPSGWHVPSDTEWTVMRTTATAMSKKAIGKNLKAAVGWNSPSIGLDAFGFRALPAGRYYLNVRSDASFVESGASCHWWSSTTRNSYAAWNRGMLFTSEGISSEYNDKTYGYSLRCIKD